ncbi:MAG: glycosyltransferase family 2 protein [Bacteroidales bacterium]|nr:glycosyltransferase family 2 protein [Bacteroidales bacterium]MCF8405612.1 glycosyltransferase family 2 protein [Bacteroidales bacterium]
MPQSQKIPQTDKYPLVSIVTVNFNQAVVTCEFLNSMRHITYQNIEIIVVDNGSKEPVDNIERDYPEVKLIKSMKNLGFAGGNNLGIDEAKGKHLLFINNDTEVEAGFLEPLVQLLENNSLAGMVSPKIKFYHQPEVIQYAGYGKINPYTLRMHGLGYNQKDDGQFDNITETHFAHGCAMMIPRTVIDQVGKMPELYFLYYEEHDWSTRIKEAGYKIYYQPQSVVLHKESVSTGKASTLKTYYFTRNRMLFWRRNIRGNLAVLSFFYLTLIAIPKNFLIFLLSFKFKHLKAYNKAIYWHVKNIHKKYKIPLKGFTFY